MDNFWKSEKKVISLMLLGTVLALIVIRFDAFGRLLGKVFGVLTPFLIGIFLGFIINIPTKFFEKHLFKKSKNEKLIKAKKPIAFLLSLFIVALVIGLVLSMIIPQAITSIEVLINAVPPIYDASIRFIERLFTDFPDLEHSMMNMIPKPSEIITKISKEWTNWASNVANIVGGIAGAAVNLFVAFIFAIYLIFRKETLIHNFSLIGDWLFTKETKKKWAYVLEISNNIFHSFIVGQVLEAFILGGLIYIGMLIFKFPHAAMISSLMGLLALIPIVGAFLGGALGVIIISTVDLKMGILFVLFFIIIQQIEGNIIYPKVVGSQVGLPALWVLFAVMVGGGLFGVLGVFFGVPVVSIIYTLIIKKAKEYEKIL